MKKKILLVGGSALGVQIADQLLKSNLVDVTMVEKKKLSEGMSAKAGTMVHTFHTHPELSDLATESLSIYDTTMANQVRDFFTPTGSFTFLTKPQLHKARQEIRRLRGRGSSIELLSAQAAGKRFKDVNWQTKDYVIYDPEAGLLDATGLSGAIASSHSTENFQIVEDTAVESLIIEKNRILGARTSEGEFHADLTVITAGIHTLGLLKSLGLANSVGISSLESHVYESTSVLTPPPISLDPNRSGCAKFEKTEDGKIRTTLFVSSPSTTVSYGTVIANETPAARNFRERLASNFPFLRYSQWKEGSGLIDVRDNGIPGSIGYVPGVSGLYAVFGWGRKGLTMAPAIAREVSRQVVRNILNEERASRFPSPPRQEFTA